VTRGAWLLWTSFLGVCAILAAFWLSSCGGQLPAPKRAQAVSCLDLANAALAEAHSCDEARAALAKALENTPACAALFGLHLSMEDDAGVVRCDD